LKLRDILINALRSELKSSKIQIQELRSGEMIGTISSECFSGNSLAHNINLIKNILDKSLPEDQRKRVKEILPLSPKQQRYLDKFFD